MKVGGEIKSDSSQQVLQGNNTELTSPKAIGLLIKQVVTLHLNNYILKG